MASSPGRGRRKPSAHDRQSPKIANSTTVTLIDSHGVWGGFQGILIDPKTRVLQAGSDPRKDGMAAGW